jgi:hypothetical protein
VLAKYGQQLMKCSGKCAQCEYEFKIQGSMPHSANSRSIPFALRDQVHEQIQAVLQDGILEESHSAYINPITVVFCEEKAVRICSGAKRINKQIIYRVNKLLIDAIKHNNNIIIINLFIMVATCFGHS